MAVIEAKTIQETRNASHEMLRTTVEFYNEMREEIVGRPAPSYENLWGTYEELWCNCRNKVIVSTEANDRSHAFHVAIGAQEYFDEMTECKGTKKFRLKEHFDADDLHPFKVEFLHMMDEYLEEYGKVGRTVEQYSTLEQLYECYMQPSA